MPTPIPSLPTKMTPTVSGYSIGDPGGVMRTEVAGGFSRLALDWDRGAQLYAVNIIMDAAEFSVWSVFYHHLIKKGASPFLMPLDSNGVVQAHQVQMLPGSYSVAMLGSVYYTVSFSIEAENPVYDMSDADAIALVDFYNHYADQSEAFLNRLYKFARYDLEILP